MLSPSYKSVWIIAWPVVVSNLSVPMLGLVDTAVIGNLGDAAILGGVALGSTIFSILFWGFSFLRMGTTGFVAQAAGAQNQAEILSIITRSLSIAAVAAAALLLCQPLIESVVFEVSAASTQVESASAVYFNIRIFSAPANLINLCFLGLFFGLGKTRLTLYMLLLLNGSNILLDLILVLKFNLGIAGVAWASLIAEYLCMILGCYLAWQELQKHRGQLPSLRLVFALPALRHCFAVNSDIMIRTLCLTFAFAWFTQQGGIAGDSTLAANAILIQLVFFAAFFLDGFALAAESLVGQAVGAQQRDHFDRAVVISSQFSAITAVALSLMFVAAGPWLIDLLTNIDTVRQMARQYLFWACLAPILAIACFQLDGIFIGATRSQDMRNAMIFSLACYLASWWWLTDRYGNHGLWAALMIFFVSRGLSLYWYFPKLRLSVALNNPQQV